MVSGPVSSQVCLPQAPKRGSRGIVGRGRPALENAPRPELRQERGILWIIYILRLLLRIQVIQVAKEFIEAVHRWQKLVAIAEMVFAILKSHIAERLKQVGERWVLFLQAYRRAWETDLRQPGANRALPGDKRRASGRAALLPVVVGEERSLFR
jgi:hypothetical protein